MFSIKMKKKGLTLLEIIFSVLIIAVIMAGVTNLFVSGKRWILHARMRMTGGELGRQFLDPWQMQVRQDEWATNCLGAHSAPGSGCISFPNAVLADWTDSNGVRYIPSYEISQLASPLDNLRKIKLTVTWTERSPTGNP